MPKVKKVTKGCVKCICKTCNKEFYIYPSDFKEGKGKNCSKKCQNIYQKSNLNDGCFKKGHKPPLNWIKSWSNKQKGKKLSKETIEKMKLRTGKLSPRWKGGRYKSNSGYIYILNKEHPFCNSKGYVREHRLVMENHIGRYLTSKEVVHHINNNPSDNRIKNLKLFKNNGLHISETVKSKKTGIYRNCLHCHKNIYVKKCRISKNYFCSVSCSNYWHKKQRLLTSPRTNF